MKTDFPPYSVLMSVYKNDNPQYLEESIRSMANQTVKPDEIVLVEDGELTEELYEAVSRISDRFECLKIVSLAANGGLGNALNCGMKYCKNELLARMDADDISLPDRCEKQLQRFTENPELIILGTQINEFVGDETRIISSRRVPENFEEILRFAHRRSPFNHPTVMYKKSEVLKYGGYGQYRRNEDLDLFLRMIFDRCYSENLSESLLNYRIDDENLNRRKSWKNCGEYISIMFRFFQKKEIGVFDMLYVMLGQIIMYLVPNKFAKILNKKFLRIAN